MGRTWPNLEADRVTEPGYYWNEKLQKLARLGVGEKLPRRPGSWEFIAGEREGSSSQIVAKLFERYPDMEVNDFTFTVRSPLGRRLPMGDPSPGGLRAIAMIAAVFGLGLAVGRLADRLLRPAPRSRWAALRGRRSGSRLDDRWNAANRKRRRSDGSGLPRAPLVVVLRGPQHRLMPVR